MTLDSYNPDRDITPEYLATVNRWIELTGEVFVVLRYLRMAGAKDYAFVKTVEDFTHMVSLCPDGTDLIVFRDRQLNLRGLVTDEFIREARRLIADGYEYLAVRMSPLSPDDPRLHGDLGNGHAELVEYLESSHGDFVALGPCPPFDDADNETMISASKGGIDGPR